MRDAFDCLGGEARKRLVEKAQPRWSAPMLATLIHDPFSHEQWAYERKLDGVRCLAYRRGEDIELLSRNKKSQNDRYPELVEAVASQEADDFIIDGEIVAFEGNITSFSRLQERMQMRDAEAVRRTGVSVYYYLFDILYIDGHDTTGLVWRDRKTLLQRNFRFQDPLRFTRHRNRTGKAFLEEACGKGWEGLIAKKADSNYVQGRSTSWLKFKCVRRQEFVIGGYTDPRGQRTGFGALLIGYYDDGHLRYAGKVGTGYDEETLGLISRKLSSLERKSPAFAGAGKIGGKGTHWVSPELVAEIGFTEWTGDGRLRHPRYLGLRDDKDPKEVRKDG